MFNTCDYVSDINRFKQKVRSVTQLYEDNCFTCVDDNLDDCIVMRSHLVPQITVIETMMMF